MTRKIDSTGGKAEVTITCEHCRYEYDSTLARCPICGYPWPWLKKKEV